MSGLFSKPDIPKPPKPVPMPVPDDVEEKRRQAALMRSRAVNSGRASTYLSPGDDQYGGNTTGTP